MFFFIILNLIPCFSKRPFKVFTLKQGFEEVKTSFYILYKFQSPFPYMSFEWLHCLKPRVTVKTGLINTFLSKSSIWKQLYLQTHKCCHNTSFIPLLTSIFVISPLLLPLSELFDDHLLLFGENSPYGFIRLSIGDFLCALVCGFQEMEMRWR